MGRCNGQQRLSARERGYSAAWEKARAGFLRLHPQCAECARGGLIVRATVVDHITPHRGDQRLFWDQGNWQSLCTNHHSSWKQQVEKRGYSARVLANGLPSDPSHPFYAAAAEQPSPAHAHQWPPQARPLITGQREGGSKVIDRRGAGPSGDKRAELITTGPVGLSGGETARPSPSWDRSAGAGQQPSISAAPSLIRGSHNG